MSHKTQRRQLSPRQTLAKVPQNEAFESHTDFSPQEYFDGLNTLSEDELAYRYTEINNQSHMMKGLILLKARERFPSNKEFSAWIAIHGLSVDSQQNRTLFMNLAKFFKDRDRTGISLTAAYAIAAPANENVAEEVYQEALNKSLSVKAVKQLIEDKKSISHTGAASESVATRPKKVKNEVGEENVVAVINLVKGFNLSESETAELFKECIKRIKAEVNTTSEAMD